MNDPKNHAKVLALRWEAMWEAAQTEDCPHRLNRLLGLTSRLNGLMDYHEERTGWLYMVWLRPPRWKYTVTITDTEEE